MEACLDKSPLVSIIVPIFNGEKYLIGTIESVIAQTYLNWEMILVDDCSTDTTPSIVNKFVGLDTRIRNITLESCSGGPALPRNKGLSVASGEYIAFIDSDDVWAKEKLSVQVASIQRSNVDVIHCGATVINSTDQQIGQLNSSKKFKCIDFFFGQSDTLMIFNPIVLSSVLLKNTSEVVFREESQFHAIEDWLLWIELSLKGKKIRMISENLLSYREHYSSISALDGEKQYLKGFYLYSVLLLERRVGLGKYFLLNLIHLSRTLKARVLRTKQ